MVNTTTSSRSSVTMVTSADEEHNVAVVVFPQLCVFDLDACFWDQDTYSLQSFASQPLTTLIGDLNGRGRGVIGVVYGDTNNNDEKEEQKTILKLHPGALYALQQHLDGTYGTTMKMAFCSSAVTPLAERIGRDALKLLQVVPGMTVWDLVVNRDWQGRDINAIGRQPPLLSCCKAASHFPLLRRQTGVRYDRMLFFDDCTWDDHCAEVRRECREADSQCGPTVVRTPQGLGMKEWKEGLALYSKEAAAGL